MEAINENEITNSCIFVIECYFSRVLWLRFLSLFLFLHFSLLYPLFFSRKIVYISSKSIFKPVRYLECELNVPLILIALLVLILSL